MRQISQENKALCQLHRIFQYLQKPERWNATAIAGSPACTEQSAVLTADEVMVPTSSTLQGPVLHSFHCVQGAAPGLFWSTAAL